jgi:hypothetical protein
MVIVTNGHHPGVPMSVPRPLALITGASSGLGVEFALELANQGYDLLLTGRDLDRLGDTAARARKCGAVVDSASMDLGTQAGVAELIAWAGSRPLEVLVNNAGFGLSGNLLEETPEALAAMIFVNVSALTQLTRAFLPGMVARGRGRILNIASAGAFQACPGMASYCATKSYVLHFSEAVAEELEGTGVSVTALCPGPTRTRFADRASMTRAPHFRDAMAAGTVARSGITAMLAGRRIRVPGARNSLMAFSVRFAPRRAVARIAKGLVRRDDCAH